MVAKFKKSADAEFEINPEECYAELWMGTHPSGPARVAGGGLLLDWLADKPEKVGRVPAAYPANNLPFLFKVLSVRTALSIQAHPNKTLAQELHSKFPDIYKDPNHKPEMVIALTEFECMCGFRSLSEISAHLEEYPELHGLIHHSEGVAEAMAQIAITAAPGLPDGGPGEEQMLRLLLDQYMKCPEEVAAKLLQDLVTRLQTKDCTPLELLLLRLAAQYPGDKGVFSPLLMNYVILQPGESFFIGANELHAYLSGECVECMALSDNVVRAGLTPKFKDAETLCAMLVYKSRLPDFLTPLKIDDCSVLYRPPADCCAEFEVERITVPAHTTYTPPPVPCGAMLLMISGEDGTASGSPNAPLPLKAGSVVFVGASEDINITTGGIETVFYRAHVNLG